MLVIIGFMVALYATARSVSALGYKVATGESQVGIVAWILCAVGEVILAVLLNSSASSMPTFSR